MKSIIILIAIVGFGSCQSSSTDMESTPWSEKLADAVMLRNDSLAIYNNPNTLAWRYDLAMLGQAIDKVSTGDDKYFNYHKRYIDLYVDANGDILTYDPLSFNIDNVNPAKGLITLYEKTKDNRYKSAIDIIMNQVKNQPVTEEGFMAHKAIYSDQVWLNSTYMLAPFLTQYANVFDNPQWYDVATQQLIYTYNLTVDSTDGLLFHAWDATKTQYWANSATGTSPNKWSRAMGYYMMALVDVLELLPKNHSDRPELEKILKKTSNALLEAKDEETDLWFQVLNLGNKEFNYIETSGSAMFIYAFAKGAHLGILRSKYLDVAADSFEQLTKKYIKTGSDQLPTLTHISGSAGLGYKKQRDGTFEYYINQKQIDNDPRGMAAVIMAAIELGE